MQTIAITGASGYIGKNLVEALMQLGVYQIKVLSRSMGESLLAGVRVVLGDLEDPESLIGFFEPGDTVINLVYLWGAGESKNLAVIDNLLRACKQAKVKRLIHCSTAAVVGRVKVDVITDDTPCHPVTEYGLTKYKVECAVTDAAKAGLDVVTLRPTSVFGPSGAPLKNLADDLVAGNRLKNYLKSCLFGRRRMNLVSVTNVVAAIEFFIRSEVKFHGEVFIVSDDVSSMNNFVDVEAYLLAKFLVKPYGFPRLPISSSVIAILLRLMGRNNVNPNCNYVSNKLNKLGFWPPKPFEDALAEYAEWYCAQYLVEQKRP